MSDRASDVLRLISGVAICALAAQFAWVPPAYAQAARPINIAPMPLVGALSEFATQSHASILAAGDLTAGKTSRGWTGTAEPAKALARLLYGTGLTFRRSGEAFVIVAMPAAPAAPPTAVIVKAPARALIHAESFPLGEVIVTATRQISTANRAALSLTAFNQQTLDEQGIKTFSEFARFTPSVVFTRSGTESNPNIAIRGISSTLGAPTTGVYLDDTPLQKRGTNDAVTGNGSPTPQIFDLDRIEVLRGPQGTLFGSGSEGGTIRFVTPQPSLSRWTAYLRSEVSVTEQGAPSYEAGAVLGGPLVEDKLGFRVSLWSRKIGGYLDHVSLYDGSTIARDTNSGRQAVGRLAVAWRPTANLKISPSLYLSLEHADDTDIFFESIPKFATNAGTFTNKVRIGPPASGLAPDNNGFFYQFPTATLPSYSFGPYAFGPYKSGAAVYYDNNCGACTAYKPFGPSQILIGAQTVGGVLYPARVINVPGQQPGANRAEVTQSPRTSTLLVPSLDIEFNLNGRTLKSITSYVDDDARGDVGGQFGARTAILPTSTTSPTTVGGQFLTPGGTDVPGGSGSAFITIPTTPYQYSDFAYYNRREAFTQEFRVNSDPVSRPFTWVAGAFFSAARQNQQLTQPATEAQTAYDLRGIDEAFTLNSLNVNPATGNNIAIDFTCNTSPNPGTIAPNAVYNCVETTRPGYNGNSVILRKVHITDRELAAFGEANYFITENLKLTAGLRIAEISNTYTQFLQGSVYGNPFPDQGFTATPGHPFAVPGDKMSTTISGSQTEHPVTPHVGVSWQASADSLLYVSVAEGYRAGGVNAPASLGNCAAQLAMLGTPQTPLSYNSDKVWSYEAGTKLRLVDGHAQINSSIFYIDWRDPQLTMALTCGSSYVTNAGAAASKGFDVQSQLHWGGLTVSPSVAYTDAVYTQNVPVPGTATFLVRKGMALPAPQWQAALAARYDFRLLDRYPAFVRGDYEYQSDYVRTNPGQANYDPVTARGAQTHILNARAGLILAGYDMNLFVNNLTNSQDRLTVAHTFASALVTASTFRPREVGLQLIYRY